MLQALIFDVDGTLADTEDAHRAAFNAAFAQAGLGWHWNEALYTRLLDVAGGRERIAHFWQMVDPVAARSLRARNLGERIHAIKTRIYAEQVAGGRLALRPGVQRLIREAHAAGMPMAIATTTTPANLDALLCAPLGRDWRKFFAAVCDGASAVPKKPAPDIYHLALRALGLPAHACIAFEDSENGLRAATEAGISTIVTPTSYTALHYFGNALLMLPHLGDPGQPIRQRIRGADHRWVDLAALTRWHEGCLFEAG